MEQEQQKRYRAWAEIDLNALTHNVQTVQNRLPAQTQFMAVVKANAYGHGDAAICQKLWELGVRWFAVSNLEEALSVRQLCPYGEIFILGYTPPEFAPELARNNIIQGVLSLEYARQLQSFAHQPVRCHIKLDTGMGRIGFRSNTPEDCAKALLPLFELDKLSIEGIYTHFAVADSVDADDMAYTQAQEDFIVAVYDRLAGLGHTLKHLHFMNSAATVTRPQPQSHTGTGGHHHVRTGTQLPRACAYGATAGHVPAKRGFPREACGCRHLHQLRQNLHCRQAPHHCHSDHWLR